MNERSRPPISGPEVVGLFADRAHFEAAVAALMTAGFTHPDLSVLASHEAIEAADPPDSRWRTALTALVGELRYEGPLVASGAIVLAGGPLAAALAAIIGAAVGGIALKEVLEEATSAPHTDDFARSLAAGSVILWVRVASDDRQRDAIRILEEQGAENVHVCEPPGAA